MTILDKLAEHAFERVKAAERSVSLDEIKSLAFALPKDDFEFEKVLKKPDISFICECKKASPSRVLLQRISPILKLQRNTKRQVQTVFPC